MNTKLPLIAMILNLAVTLQPVMANDSSTIEAQIARNYEAINSNIGKIENLISEAKYNDAFRLAQSHLKNAYMKLGYKEGGKTQLPIPMNLVNDEEILSANLNLNFSDLPHQAKIRIEDELMNYRGGLFMDIVKLIKRLNVLTVKAIVKKELAKKSKNMSILKAARETLVKSYDLPITVGKISNQVGNENTFYTLFDSDVIDGFSLTLFQNEILDLAKEIDESGEEAFLADVANYKKAQKKLSVSSALMTIKFVKNDKVKFKSAQRNGDGSVTYHTVKFDGYYISNETALGACRSLGKNQLIDFRHYSDGETKKAVLNDFGSLVAINNDWTRIIESVTCL